jgi:hypothetical protein
VRPGHLLFLIRTLSKAPTLTSKETAEFRANEMDFTVFAIEATFAGALELNDYILTG